MSAAPVPLPTAATRLVALLGWPVAHSRSPQMHNAAFRAAGVDLVYLALPTPPDRVAEVVGVLGAVGAVGANITVPHKLAVLPLCDEVSDEARLVGAVNTLVWTDDGLRGDNTDATGLFDDLVGAGVMYGDAAVVFGTGGAARAAAVALGRLAARVLVVGRDLDAATRVAAVARDSGADARVVAVADVASDGTFVRTARVVINATPLGMNGESLPVTLCDIGAGQLAYDLVYDPAETPFLAAARTHGAETRNGFGMLLGQAAAAWTQWTGRPAPREVMHAALVDGTGTDFGLSSPPSSA